MTEKSYIKILVAVGTMLCLLSLLVLPNSDDWFFFKYFDLSLPADAAVIFGAESLYWRPVQEFIFWLISRVPQLFPHAQHVLVGVFNTLNAVLVFTIVGKFVKRAAVAFVAALFFLLCTMSMASTFSIDSFAQVFATSCGAFSAWYFLSHEGAGRYAVWLTLCLIGSLTKETGLPWLFAVPLLSYLHDYRQIGATRLTDKRVLQPFIINCVIAAAVVIVYFGVRLTLFPDSLDTAAIEADDNPYTSYEVTPTVLLKNLLILFVAPILPVDTSALMYKYDLWIGVVTVIMSVAWIIALWKILRAMLGRVDYSQVLAGALLLLCIASPSLVTRAGELSAYPVVLVIALLGGMCIDGINVSRHVKWVALTAFFLTALVTDAHKFYLIYRAGKIGNEMAQEVVNRTTVTPRDVLIISVDDYTLAKAGAMHVVPGTSYHEGDAVRRLYGYRYPITSKKVMITPHNAATVEAQIDSVLTTEHSETYDCVWINNGLDITVINNH